MNHHAAQAFNSSVTSRDRSPSCLHTPGWALRREGRGLRHQARPGSVPLTSCATSTSYCTSLSLAHAKCSWSVLFIVTNCSHGFSKYSALTAKLIILIWDFEITFSVKNLWGNSYPDFSLSSPFRPREVCVWGGGESPSSIICYLFQSGRQSTTISRSSSKSLNIERHKALSSV